MKHFFAIFILFVLFFAVRGEDVEESSTGELLNPKFVFLFIGDGMGSVHPIMSQIKLQEQDVFLGIDFLKFPVQLPTVTRSADKVVTDSAAGATAIACGVKTNNGYLGLDAEGKAVESIVEYAKRKNRKVGIISSTNINSATPAAFFSHSNIKVGSYSLGAELIKSNFDLIAGGVLLNHSIPNKKRLYDLAEESGYTVIRALKQINELNIAEGEKILATVPKKMEYNRHPRYGNVTLAQLVQFGIDFLMNENGFVMVIEGGLIEVNSHANQTNAVVGEIAEFNDAVKVAYDFAKMYPKSALVIVTADHETGDLQTMDNKNFYWKSYGNTAKDITTYIFGANQEYFIPETDTQFHNSDIGKKLKEMIQ